MEETIEQQLMGACAAIDVECVLIGPGRYQLITPIATFDVEIRGERAIFMKNRYCMHDFSLYSNQMYPKTLIGTFDHLCHKYVERCAAKKMELGLANIAAKIDRLLEENARLMQENSELRLLPGAPEYYAAKAHYESLERK